MRISADVSEQMKITSLYTAFSPEYESGYSFKGELHNFWEIVIVTEGKIGAAAGSQVFLLKKGQAIIHEPMELHRIWVEGTNPAKTIIITFGATKMPTFSSKVFEIEDLGLAEEILSEIRTAFVIRDICTIGIKDGGELLATMATKKLEMLLLDTALKQKKMEIKEKSQRAKDFETVVKLLEENESKSLTVADIAKMSGMSEANLQKMFAAYAGIGVMAYFNRLKITSAVSMIQIGKSIKEVAEELGFQNQNYFSTVFKRIMKDSPSYYKERITK